jgi:hypothetical protein
MNERGDIAEKGEWNQKGATLSDVTAQAEYGVSQEFIIKGIECGKLECRQGSIWGSPYLRVLRRQLEAFITEDRGGDYLLSARNQAELNKIRRDISALKKTLKVLESRKAELEIQVKKE